MCFNQELLGFIPIRPYIFCFDLLFFFYSFNGQPTCTSMILVPYPTLDGGSRKGVIVSKYDSVSTLQGCRLQIQSTLVISKSKGLTEILQDMRTSTYQS